jgi:hypothetical protein
VAHYLGVGLRLETTATKRFQSGKWDGFYMHQGKRNELVLELQFSHGGAVNGTGQDSTGFFSITGVYKYIPTSSLACQVLRFPCMWQCMYIRC